MPRLIAISGPLAGATLPLGEGETSIGRDEANGLPIPDPSLPPHQAVVTCRHGLATLRDVDIVSPTFVNGLPAGDASLKDGDELQIGASLFLLRLDGAEENQSYPTVVDRAAVDQHSIVAVRREDVMATDLAREPLPPDRLERDLTALIRITASINAVRGLVGLARPLLELMADAIPATRGVFVLSGDRPGEIGSAVGWSRDGQVHQVQLSRTVMDRVLRDGAGILSVESSGPPAPSVLIPVLAVPLVAFDRIVGAIVMEGSASGPRFDRGHLHLALAIAGVAATVLEHEQQLDALEQANRQLRAEIALDHNMVGDSKAMHDVYRRIARVAPADSTVLLTGESGTGKELAARAIHRNGPRAEKPFVAINCAAITDTLLESELFGHEKGAFTGAVAQKKGKLETAEGGTVFLDEIGELSLGLQAKLLRVLQHREFERVGGVKPVHVDFRLIAATNRDLEAAIAAGAFRRDLFYRLNVVALTMPALRERRADIPLLANWFLRKHRDRAARPVSGFTAETLACLTAYDWPGNVRELENAIEHAVVLGLEPLVVPDDLPESIVEATAGAPRTAGAPATGFHDAVKQAKSELIVRAFREAGGNYNRAARLLGLNPNYLHRLIKNLQLKELLEGSE